MKILINNQTFIHIQNKFPHWNVGQVIDVGNDFNPYSKYYIGDILRPHDPDFQKKQFREQVLEEVRRDKFPNRPSRQKGIWVATTNSKKIMDWLGALCVDKTILKVLKVELSGSIHYAKEEYMRFAAYELSNKELSYKNATMYWSGVSVEDADECLFVGKVRVLEDITNKYQ